MPTFQRFIDLYIGATRGPAAVLFTSRRDTTPVATPQWVEGDKFLARLHFLDWPVSQGAEAGELTIDGTDSLVFSGKIESDPDSEFLFETIGFSEVVFDTTKHRYEALIDLTSAELVAAMNDEAGNQLRLRVTLQDRNAANTERLSFTFPLVVLAAGINGAENGPSAVSGTQVLEIAGRAARFDLPDTTRIGTMAKDIGIKAAGTITCEAEAGQLTFDNGAGGASTGRCFTASNADASELWAFYFTVAGVGTEPAKKYFATKVTGTITCAPESGGDYGSGGVGAGFYLISADGLTYAVFYNSNGTDPDGNGFSVGIPVAPGASAALIATAFAAAITTSGLAVATASGAVITYTAPASGSYAGTGTTLANTLNDPPFAIVETDGTADIEWPVPPTYAPIDVAPAATAAEVATAAAAAIAESTCPAVATATGAVVSYQAAEVGVFEETLIAENDTGFDFSAESAGLAATGAIFELIDPSQIATAAGWANLSVIENLGRIVFGAYGTIADAYAATGVTFDVTYGAAGGSDINIDAQMNRPTGVWTAAGDCTLLVLAAIRCQSNLPPRNIVTLNKKAAGAGSFSVFQRLCDMTGFVGSGEIGLRVLKGDQLKLTAFQNSGFTDGPGGADSFVQIMQLNA